jgi:hypothetical protein
MGKATRASALMLLLACSAQAGIMQNEVTGTPPPPPSATQEGQTAGGWMPNDLTETLLSVLDSVLALL